MVEIPPNTVVETPDGGALAVCDCREQRPDDVLFAHGAPGSERLVQIRRDARATNRYADGVAGVTKGDHQAAQADDEPYCPECENYVRGWLHAPNER